MTETRIKTHSAYYRNVLLCVWDQKSKCCNVQLIIVWFQLWSQFFLAWPWIQVLCTTFNLRDRQLWVFCCPSWNQLWYLARMIVTWSKSHVVTGSSVSIKLSGKKKKEKERRKSWLLSRGGFLVVRSRRIFRKHRCEHQNISQTRSTAERYVLFFSNVPFTFSPLSSGDLYSPVGPCLSFFPSITSALLNI